MTKPIKTKEWVIGPHPIDPEIKVLTLYSDIETPVASINLEKDIVEAVVKTTGYNPPEKKPFWGVFIVVMISGLILTISFVGAALTRLAF
jgi:hypothetical protein